MGADKIESRETIEGTIIPPEFEPVFRLNVDLRPSPLLYDEENEPDFEWTAKVSFICLFGSGLKVLV